MKYELNIKRLLVAKTFENVNDFVVQVDWEYVGRLDNKQCSRNGTASFNSTGSQFIPFNELTKDIVSGWIVDSVDFNEIDASMDEQLNDLVNPKIVAEKLPWENNET